MIRVTFLADWSQKLLDIFSVHPHTACNTHDLLDCPCEASNIDLSPKISREDLRKVLDEESSSDEDEDPMKGFMAASQVKQKDINKIDKAVCASLCIPG